MLLLLAPLIRDIDVLAGARSLSPFLCASLSGRSYAPLTVSQEGKETCEENALQKRKTQILSSPRVMVKEEWWWWVGRLMRLKAEYLLVYDTRGTSGQKTEHAQPVGFSFVFPLLFRLLGGRGREGGRVCVRVCGDGNVQLG